MCLKCIFLSPNTTEYELANPSGAQKPDTLGAYCEPRPHSDKEGS
jgi:hypothetical protein